MNDLSPSLLVLTAVLALAAGTLGASSASAALSRAGVSRREIDWKAVELYLSGAARSPAQAAGPLMHESPSG